MAQYAIGLFYFWGDMPMNFQRLSGEEFAACEKANAKEALKCFLAYCYCMGRGTQEDPAKGMELNRVLQRFKKTLFGKWKRK